MAKIQESIQIVKDERKYLLRKLLEYENEHDVSQIYYRNDSIAANGPRVKLKKRFSNEDNGRISMA